MKNEPSAIRALVLAGLKKVLEESGVTWEHEPDDNASLLGPQSILDSLGLVTLLVELEERLEDEFDLPLTLADERAMSQKSSPFRTVESLASYISTLLEEESQSV